MAKSTGTVTIKRSRNGTTIRATGSAAQALFDAMVKSAEQAASSSGRIKDEKKSGE
jgi:hypothetical protein